MTTLKKWIKSYFDVHGLYALFAMIILDAKLYKHRGPWHAKLK